MDCYNYRICIRNCEVYIVFRPFKVEMLWSISCQSLSGDVQRSAGGPVWSTHQMRLNLLLNAVSLPLSLSLSEVLKFCYIDTWCLRICKKQLQFLTLGQAELCAGRLSRNQHDLTHCVWHVVCCVCVRVDRWKMLAVVEWCGLQWTKCWAGLSWTAWSLIENKWTHACKVLHLLKKIKLSPPHLGVI